MAKKKTKKKSNTGKVVAIAGATLAAAALGVYFYGKDGKKHRKKFKSWMLRAKADVLDKVEGLKDVTKEKYNEVVESVVAKYAKMKRVSKKDADALKKKLKSHWNEIHRQSQSAKKRASKKRKAAKSTKRKSSKKK